VNTIFMFGLLVVFALGTLLMTYILISDPDKQPKPEFESMQKAALPATYPPIIYGIFAALMLFLCALTVLARRSHT
jgi:biotin transporter BioY